MPEYWLSSHTESEYIFIDVNISKLNEYALVKRNSSDYSNITHLNFDDNIIEDLPANFFNKLDNLQEISFNSNNIKILVKNIFKNNFKLRKMSFMRNSIYSLKCSIEHLKDLRFIDFTGNSLTVFEQLFFKPMLNDTLIKVYINENDLSCDCNMLWFLKKESFKTHIINNIDDFCFSHKLRCILNNSTRSQHISCKNINNLSIIKKIQESKIECTGMFI